MKIFTWSTGYLSLAFILIYHDLISAEVQSLEGKEEERPDENAISRERRALKVAYVLIGTTLGVSFANIGWDVFLTSKKGCCKLKGWCPKQENLPKKKQKWLDLADDIDEYSLDVSKQITYLDSTNTKNQVIKTKLAKIINTVDLLVETLLGDQLDELKELQQKIDDTQRENADLLATWTVMDINVAFKGLSATETGTLLLITPLFLELGTHFMTHLYKSYKVRKIAARLYAEDMWKAILRNSKTAYAGTNAYKTMASHKFTNKKLLKKAALAEYKAARGARSKFTKRVTKAFSIFTIGFEAWHIAENTKKCLESLEKVDELHKSFKEEIAKLQKSKKLIKNAETKIGQGYSLLTDSISSDDFLSGIQSIKDMVAEASTQDATTKQTAADIETFKLSIQDAVKNKESQKINDLQDKLSSALTNIQYTYDCYLNKAKAISNVIFGCKSGTSLEELYEREKPYLEACVVDTSANTPIYVSLEILENAISADAKINNYFGNCILNKKEMICSKYCYTDLDSIATDYDITVDEVNMVCKDVTCPLSTNDRTRICKYKGRGTTFEEAVVDYGEMYRDEIKALYDDDDC